MRRNDREITDREQLLDILHKCDVIRVGLNTPDYPYVVPMNFGIESEGEALIIWLHCAPEGQKLDLIKKDNRAGFEADCSHNLISNEAACRYTMEYESVIGHGNISICDDNSGKLRGLKAIMRHFAPEKDVDFAERELSGVCVLRLDVTQITGKRLKKS
jgi:nitroimidazol reductase NimA-like FMN-containing flavoprotein (pyridoxamine 5'-phosphate oxidase superfamily)